MRLICPHCRNPMEVQVSAAEQVVGCPSCGRRLKIPGKSQADATSPSGAPEVLPMADAPASDQAPFEDEAAGPAISFYREEDDEEDLDMTPMVDVTFLLLIFFMITAAFAMQKALELPPPDREEASTQARTLEEILEDDDYVIVRIARDNTMWIDDREAFSEQDLLSKLREARNGGLDVSAAPPSSLLVVADSESKHKTVVMALDVGREVGMENVRLATVDEEEF